MTMHVVHRKRNYSLPQIKVSFYPERNNFDRIRLRQCSQVYELAMSLWDKETINLYEEFKVIYLDRSNAVIGCRELSRGNIIGTVVDVKLIITIALQCNASGVILVHNHPSGNMNPSKADLTITSKVKQATEFFELILYDHLIISGTEYFSFSDEGVLER